MSACMQAKREPNKPTAREFLAQIRELLPDWHLETLFADSYDESESDEIEETTVVYALAILQRDFGVKFFQMPPADRRPVAFAFDSGRAKTLERLVSFDTWPYIKEVAKLFNQSFDEKTRAQIDATRAELQAILTSQSEHKQAVQIE